MVAKLEELLELAISDAEQARQSLGPDEDWPLRVLAIKAGENAPVEVLPGAVWGGGKADVLEQLRRWIVDEDVELFSFTCVVFMATAPRSSHPEAPLPAPRTQPDSKETLFAMALDADHLKIVVADIGRPAAAPPTLGEWTMIDTGSGRLAEPFIDALKIARRKRRERGGQ